MSEEDKNVGAVEAEDTPMHPVVELIIKRLASNPQEYDEWRAQADRIGMYTTKKEKAAIKHALREAVLGEAHASVMKRLLAEPKPKTEDGVKFEKRTSPAEKLLEIRRKQVEEEMKLKMEAEMKRMMIRWGGPV